MADVSNAQEIIERFKKVGPQTVEYKGSKFLIRKINAMEAFFAKEVLNLPFVSSAIGKWNTLSKEEQKENTMEWLANKEYSQAFRKATVMVGVVEPPFSDKKPCPEGYVPYEETDESLLEFLSIKILELSNFDLKASEFFRPDANRQMVGNRHAEPKV